MSVSFAAAAPLASPPARPAPFRRSVLSGLLLAALLSAVMPVRADDAVTPDGGVYRGGMRDGRLHGQGRIEWRNGAYREGAFVEGLSHGKGVAAGASGWRYEGGFDNGLMQGKGRMRFADGSEYEGEFRADEFDGKGRYVRANGEVYEGSFRKGRFHGEGRLELADGRVYVGRFEDDEPVGSMLVIHDDRRYEGGLADWEPEGEGRFTDAQGNVFEGAFVAGALTGKGKASMKNGARYEGDFDNWRFHGQGVFRNADGDEYRGGFAWGLYDGEGTMTYARPKPDGRTRDSGTWRRGKLYDPAAEALRLRNVETALYSQPALLERHLQSLQPQDPARIDLYLLAVAGDGREEVFRREVEFVRGQFDRDFGTAGRSLALVNSRSSVDAVPLATRTSLRQALRAVAGRMDVEQDILFLFLTSHGSETHELTFKLAGIDMPDLPAAALGEMLRESGIRWKVVVVSACYSGGFADAIGDQGTLVITSARHDRTSFGCADDNDFTYFGRAYFKESLVPGVSFIDAFDKASGLVETWEREDVAGIQGEGGKGGQLAEEEHSRPVIVAPAPIREQLRRWKAQPAR